jgi:hypothetical protein
MIDVKTAVARALKYVQDLFGPDMVSDPRLEEVELTDDNFWVVTLSYFTEKSPEPPSLVNVLRPPSREYRVVRLRADTGEVRSVKLWDRHAGIRP